MLRKFVLLGTIFLVLVLVIFFLFRDKIMAKNAGLFIQTEPSATVFIDGEQVGTTPFKLERKPGNVEIKLIPFSQDTPLAPYQTEVTLINKIETVVRRTFGQTDAQSSGEVLYFDKVGGKASSLSVVSNPDASQVTLDGSSIGFTPLRRDIEPGQHTIRIAISDNSVREVNIQAIRGYRLTVVVKLAQVEEAGEETTVLASPSPEVSVKTGLPAGRQVEILTTPTGFLRVRSEPSTAATESARVTPGKKYTFLEEKTGWFKIEYEEGKSGWVSAQYAKEATP